MHLPSGSLRFPCLAALFLELLGSTNGRLLLRTGSLRHKTSPKSSVLGYVYKAFNSSRPEVVEDVRSSTPVHIVYTGDAESFVGLLPSMLSVTSALEAPENATFHLVLRSADMSRAADLVGCFHRELLGRSLRSPTVLLHRAQPPRISNGGNRVAGRNLARWDLIFAYWYLPAMLPGVPRVLKLDTDTVVRSDVGPLFRLERGLDRGLAAVVQYNPQNPQTSYFLNAGVMLLDLDVWRHRNITGALEYLAHIYPKKHDQGLMDFLFNRLGYVRLELAWNLEGLGAVRNRYTREVEEAGHILHWSYNFKPWLCPRMDMASEFRRSSPRQECPAWPLAQVVQNSTVTCP